MEQLLDQALGWQTVTSAGQSTVVGYRLEKKKKKKQQIPNMIFRIITGVYFFTTKGWSEIRWHHV